MGHTPSPLIAIDGTRRPYTLRTTQIASKKSKMSKLRTPSISGQTWFSKFAQTCTNPPQTRTTKPNSVLLECQGLQIPAFHVR